MSELSFLINAGSPKAMEASSDPQGLSILLRDTLRAFLEVVRDERLQSYKTRGEAGIGVWPTLHFMRDLLRQAWTLKSNDTQELLVVLSVASRDQKLRSLFGGYFDQTSRPQDSILAYVLDPIIRDHCGARDSEVLQNALRLVSNCVADSNHNRKLALQKNAIKILLRLGRQRKSIDFVIPVLYNLCVEYDDPVEQVEQGTPVASKANPAQLKLAHSDTENAAIKTLLDMLSGTSMENDDRQTLLAALIEMAALTAPEDLVCIGVTPEMDSVTRWETLYRGTRWLFGHQARALASHSGDAAVSICKALLNLLALQEAKEILISERLLQNLAEMSHIVDAKAQELLGDDEEAETLANLQRCEKALLREFYTLSGMPEFAKMYTIDDDFIQLCIERPQNPELWTHHPHPFMPTMAIAYTVLANITIFEEVAFQLVHGYRVHETLQAVLRDFDTVDALYPALGFSSRLALPSANKQEMVNCGMLDAIRRFLGAPNRRDPKHWTPALRVEALTVLRRLISGQFETLTILHQGSDSGCYWRDVLDLFTACNDTSTKIEVGRLFVEHFRTISAAQDQLSHQSKLYDQTMNQNNLAEPIAFLACEGASPGAKAEGWFGLGLMTFWTQPRAHVLRVMQNTRMLEEIDKVSSMVDASNRPCVDNLRLVLSKLDLDQGVVDVSKHAREVFASAKQKLGLDA